jgi:hypothetical protein
MAINIKRNIETFDDSILESFIENNSQFYKFNKKINILENIKWRWYHPFFDRSKGYINFSRVGYNVDKSCALVYCVFNMVCFAYAEYFVLEEENGNWNIISILPVWIS